MSANLLFEHICIDQSNFACNLIISCENSRIGNNFVLSRIQMKFASVKLLNMNENRIERTKLYITSHWAVGTFFHIYIGSHIGIINTRKKKANKNHADIKHVWNMYTKFMLHRYESHLSQEHIYKRIIYQRHIEASVLNKLFYVRLHVWSDLWRL